MKTLRRQKLYYQKKCIDLQKSRALWKSKRPIPKKAARVRRTVLNPIQDLLFTVQFDITGLARRRMKAFFRKLKIDFFAVNRSRNELLNSLSPKSEWNYAIVSVYEANAYFSAKFNRCIISK